MSRSSEVALARRGDMGGWLVVALLGVCLVVIWRSINTGAAAPATADLVPWRLDHSQAFRDAEKLGRPAFVYFTADWCPPCQVMKAEVYGRPEVGTLLEERFVPIKVDMTDPAPGSAEHRLAAYFGVQYLPTMLVLSAQGEVVDAHYGALEADAFVAWLRRSLPAQAAPADTASPAT